MRHRVIIFACGILVLVLVLLFTGFSARDRALTSTDSSLTQRAQLAADSVDRTLQQRMIGVFTLAALPSLRSLAASDEIDRQVRLPAARAELAAIVAADPNVRAASIIDLTGKVIVATDATMNENWGDRVFAQQAFRGQLYASVPVREFGEISQYYSAPLLNNSREVAGALVLRVAVQELWAAFDNLTDVLLVDEKGVRIADTSAKPQTFVALEPLSADVMASAYRDKIYGPETTQIRSTSLTDLAAAVRRQLSHVTYRDGQGQTIHAALDRLRTNSWTAIVLVSEDSILAPVRDTLWTELGIALVSAFIGAVAMFLSMSTLRSNGKAR